MTSHGDPGPDCGPVDAVDLTGDLKLCWVIYATKPAHPWIVDLDPDHADRPHGCACARCCGHEQDDGPLPTLYAARIRAAFRHADHDDDTGGST